MNEHKPGRHKIEQKNLTFWFQWGGGGGKGGWKDEVCSMRTNNPASQRLMSGEIFTWMRSFLLNAFKWQFLWNEELFLFLISEFCKSAMGSNWDCSAVFLVFSGDNSSWSTSDTTSSADTGVFISFGSCWCASDAISPRSPSCSC